MPKTKRERFQDVAAGRVNRVISALQSLKKCSNTYNYEFNEDDVRKMFHAIRKETEEMKMAFEKGLSIGKEEFKF